MKNKKQMQKKEKELKRHLSFDMARFKLTPYKLIQRTKKKGF